MNMEKMLSCYEIVNAFFGSGVIAKNRMFFFLVYPG